MIILWFCIAFYLHSGDSSVGRWQANFLMPKTARGPSCPNVILESATIRVILGNSIHLAVARFSSLLWTKVSGGQGDGWRSDNFETSKVEDPISFEGVPNNLVCFLQER